MKSNRLTGLLLLLTLAIPFAAKADRFYPIPADLERGKTETLQFILENSVDYYGFQADVQLPSGLEAVKDEDDELDVTLTARADVGRFLVNCNDFGGGSLIISAFSSNHKPFTGTDGVLVNMKVFVTDSFSGGDVELSNVMFTNEQERDVDLEATSTYFGVAVTGITLDKTELSMTEGDTADLTATVAPADATDKAVTWTSSDNAVAIVDANGKVTAVKAGTATITATTANGKTATCTVTVAAKIIEVTGVTLNLTELSLTEGDTANLVATVAPADATDKTVTWTSSDEAVATVDAEGKVTAVKAGTATITATTANGKTATCAVTVAAKVIMVETLTIDPTSWIGIEGSEFKINATVLPENASDKTLSFESSDTTVAIVDAVGNVKILKSGSCVITVATTDGSNLTAECVLTGTSGVEAIIGSDATADVYDMNGVLVKRACAREELKELLTPGVYILRSGNATVKAVIR